MRKNGAALVLCLSAFLLTSGCWSRREPNQFAILDSSVNDMTEDGLYSLTMEIFDPSPPEAKGSSSGDGDSKSAIIIVNTVAETPPQAVLGETENMERKLYTAHTRVRFMTEKLALGNISSLMDFFIRNPESRQDPYLIVIKGENANLLYSCSTGLSDTVGAYIEAMAESQMSATSEGVFVKTLQYLKDDYLDGKDPIMGCVEIVEDPTTKQNPESGSNPDMKQYILKYKGLAAFHDGTLQGYLDGIETRAFNILTGEFKSAVISIPAQTAHMEEQEYTLFHLMEAKPKIKILFENDKVTVEADVKMTLGLAQQAGKNDILKDEEKNKRKEEFKVLMEGQLSAAVKKAQELGCDIFGFGVAMHAQKPEEWKKIKDQWDEYFKSAEFKPNVEAEIVNTGEAKEPFQLEE